MSDVEERREARRRKILENSEKRLQRITGVQQRNASYELEGYKSSQNIEDENHIENHVHNSTSSLHSNHYIPEIETVYRNPLLNPSLLNRTSTSNTKQITFTKTFRISIILGIAFIYNLLQFLYQDRNSVLNNIFLPLLCFEAIYLFYNQNSDTDDVTINIIQLFCGNIPPQYLSLVIKYFTLFITITRDVMIYFFSFVCIWFIFKVFYEILFF